MRTTINIDDDVASIVKQYAASRSISVGKAISELVRRGMNTSRPTRMVNGLLVVDLPPDSPQVITSRVRELEAEQQ